MTTSTGTPTPTATEVRTRAFVALALALVGATGGGLLGQSVVFLAMSNGPDFLTDDFSAVLVAQGLIPGGFGVAGLVLALPLRASDPVARPARGAALVLATVALVGAALSILAGALDML